MDSVLQSIFENYDIEAKLITKINENFYDVDNKYQLVYCDNIENLFLNFKAKDVRSVLYPIVNRSRKYISVVDDKYYYLILSLNQAKGNFNRLFEEIYENLYLFHHDTFKLYTLKPQNIRHKMDEVYRYLDYKFSSIEMFVRCCEARDLNDVTRVILKYYHIVLDIKKTMMDLQKKLVLDIKANKEVNYSILLNEIDLNSIKTKDGVMLLSGFTKSIEGIPSMDVVKLYLSTKDYNICHKIYIDEYFKHYESEFYYNYFCFFVLFNLIASIKMYNVDYVSAQSFKAICLSIEKFENDFLKS